MMGSVWLTCCSREAYARLFTEVRARDVQANVLRFGGMGDLSHMIDGFPNQDVNAALVAEAGDEVRYMADVVLPARSAGGLVLALLRARAFSPKQRDRN